MDFEIKGEKELLSLIKDDLTTEEKTLGAAAMEVGFSLGRLYLKLEILKLDPEGYLVPVMQEWLGDEGNDVGSVALGVGFDLGRLYDSHDNKELVQHNYDTLMERLKFNNALQTLP